MSAWRSPLRTPWRSLAVVVLAAGLALAGGCGRSEDAATGPAQRVEVRSGGAPAVPSAGDEPTTTLAAPVEIPQGPPLPASERGARDHVQDCAFHAVLWGAVDAGLSTSRGAFGLAAKTSYESDPVGLAWRPMSVDANATTRFARVEVVGPPAVEFGVSLTPEEIATDGSGIHVDRDVTDTTGQTSHLELDVSCH